MLHADSKIKFHRLKRSSLPNKDNEYAIVRWDTDESINVNEIVLKIVKSLSEPKTIRQTAKELKIGIGEIIDLVEQLIELNFICKIDGRKLKDNASKIHPWLPNINRKWFYLFLSKPILVFSFAFIISGIIIGLTTPGYLPSYKDFFWTSDLLLVMLSLFLMASIQLLIHEIGHFTATKAVGGEAKMNLGTRFIDIVVETESYHLAVIPKVFRYLVYLAGMFVDFIFIASLYWFLKITDFYGLDIGILKQILRANIVIAIGRIAWQCNVFLETDMYNFMSDFLNHDFLRANTKKYIALRIAKWKIKILLPVKKILLFLLRDKETIDRGEDLRLLLKNQRKSLVIYSIVLIVGLVICFASLIFLTIPREFVILRGAIKNGAISLIKLDLINIVKSIMLFSLVVYRYAFLFVLLKKSKNKYAVKK